MKCMVFCAIVALLLCLCQFIAIMWIVGFPNVGSMYNVQCDVYTMWYF